MGKDTKKVMEYSIQCWLCDGSGEYESSYPVCSKPASECCGGCYETYTCKYCDGLGEIYPISIDMEDSIMMLNGYDMQLKGFADIIEEMERLKRVYSEDAITTYNLMTTEHEDESVRKLYDKIDRIKKHVEILKKEIEQDLEEYYGI